MECSFFQCFTLPGEGISDVRSLNAFDRIAPFYDRIAELVFGQTIKDAQRTYLDNVRLASRILIIGGGTGWILRDVLLVNKVAQIVYLEASGRMIDLAQAVITEPDRRRVSFVHGTEELLEYEQPFDAVIANFYLDLFPPGELQSVVDRLRRSVAEGGQLVCTDFVSETPWQRALLKIMYGFFRIAAGLHTKQLGTWQAALVAGGFSEANTRAFWRGFIRSALYLKS